MDNFDSQNKKFRKYQQARGFDSIWSLYDMKSWFDRPFRGTFKMAYQGWGESKVYSKKVTNPTYATLYKLADDLIKRSGDNHHIFVEGFAPRNTSSEGFVYLELLTGS